MTESSNAPPSPDRRRGMERMKEVYGFNVDPEDMDGDFLAYTVDHLFGDVWARAGLGVDERRLITIGVLAAQGNVDLIEVQFSAALANGELSDVQVREIPIHLAHYVGWATAAKVNNIAEAVIAQFAKANES
jgi:4-carboxymuconolactone decarboxylase